jgi:peptide/nickel transport system permease protein
MGRFILRRIALALVTLWLLSVILFVACEVMPGDIARSILGSTAAP